MATRKVSLYGLAGGVAARRSIVVLVDRATSVPFTADMTCPGQTTTDSTRTASTCTVHSPAGSDPARGCKQVVGQGSHGLAMPGRPADRSLVAEDRSAGGVRDVLGFLRR